MPLPKLPPNSSPRYWFDYVTGDYATSVQHSVMFRTSILADPDTMKENVYELLNAWGADNFRIGWRVIGGRFSEKDSLFSLPFDVGADILGFRGTHAAAYSPQLEAVEQSIPFRSMTSGRKGDFSLYTARSYPTEKFRRPMPDPVRNALMNMVIGGCLQAIDTSTVTLYPYINMINNSYWERQARYN